MIDFMKDLYFRTKMTFRTKSDYFTIDPAGGYISFVWYVIPRSTS
jgi:hypothetical protein